MRTTQLTLVFLFSFLTRVLADQVELANGDRYNGNVISVSASEVRLDNEINGLMKLPRTKVRAIYFGQLAAPGSLAPLAIPRTNAPAAENGLSKIQKGEIDPKTLQQVQNEILGAATPEANAMFNDLLKGLMTGRVSSEDLRTQAKQTLDQVKSLQKEVGEGDDNPLLESYIGILQRFIDEGDSSKKPAAPRNPQGKAP